MIRNDEVIWVKGNEPQCQSVGSLMHTFDSIISKCNSDVRAGEFGRYQITQRTKAMIACYPGNCAKYVRHIDNPNQDGRCVTCIYYLNKDYDREVSWGWGEGGAGMRLECPFWGGGSPKRICCVHNATIAPMRKVVSSTVKSRRCRHLLQPKTN